MSPKRGTWRPTPTPEEMLAENTFDRLRSRYGIDRATAIIEGRDPDANADLAKGRERDGHGR